MPELPEVETVRTLIAPHVVGQRITGVSLREFTGVFESPLSGHPETLIVGASILEVKRRGKYLFFHLDNDLWITIHLRMTGRLIITSADAPRIRFEHISIHLQSGEDIRFGDQRKFGRVLVSDTDAVAAQQARLGLEPFDESLTSSWLAEKLARKTTNIKSALLDQRLIAGLGNIYVDEALWLAKLHPLRRASTLSPEELTRLLEAIRTVLETSIANQGTTFASFENPYGEEGNNAASLKVYGRAKERGSCERCGTPLVRIVAGGRGTTFCPHCQQRGDRPNDGSGNGNGDSIDDISDAAFQ